MNADKNGGKTIFGAMKDGRPLNGLALSNFVQDARAKAGLPKACRPHGLRKNLMKLLADGGASTKELQSVGGHKALKEVGRYTLESDE
jgi:site-specific recombinase XerD